MSPPNLRFDSETPHSAPEWIEEIEGLVGVGPRLLLDPRLLGALRRSLQERLGEQKARGVLNRVGFFFGLRDAIRSAGLDTSCRGRPGALPLALRLDPPRLEGAVLVSGSWPERIEAEAVLAAVGSQKEPACVLSSGYTSGWFSGIWESDLVALEEGCACRGEEACRFVVYDAAAAGLPAAARELARSLPFDSLRELVRRSLSAEQEQEGSLDPESLAVHLWGPVMVVPFAGDQTPEAIDALARAPEARDVQVVVLDLNRTFLDEAFGALALEATLRTVEARGYECIVTLGSAPSPGIAEILQERPLLVCKDLEQAIAAAFRLADARRHPS